MENNIWKFEERALFDLVLSWRVSPDYVQIIQTAVEDRESDTRLHEGEVMKVSSQ